MYAEIIVNVEAPLEGTFHYFVPNDLRPIVSIGHLVEVEFGRRLAQGIIVAFDVHTPVEETKPVITLIDDEPVVRPWQIQLAFWLSEQYLAPLNKCLRLMLPPGLTRWADVIYDINPYWDGNGRLTNKQEQLISLLREIQPLRSRQLSQKLGKKGEWKPAADQLVKRNILRRASVLDPPRVRPKKIRTASIITGPEWRFKAATTLGGRSLQADLLLYLLSLNDPLPTEEGVLMATGIARTHLDKLVQTGLVMRTPAHSIIIPNVSQELFPPQYEAFLHDLPRQLSATEEIPNGLLSNNLITVTEQPATIGLLIPEREVLFHVMMLRRAETSYRVLELLEKEMQPIPFAEIYERTGSNLNQLRRLEKLDLIRFGSEEIWRDSMLDRDYVAVEAPELTPDQHDVWNRIQIAMDHVENHLQSTSADLSGEGVYSAILLHGVTGSGKTEIYMRAIELALSRGQQAIVLVPEIALTPQTVRRFAARFQGRVAVLHSRLSDGERFDTWRRARLGLFDIVVGPRSALFAPLPNVGVIVVDEEHDASYRQTPPVPAPYYHARDTAVAAGQITGAMVILGSATPDVVSFHRAQSGQYWLLELPKRVMGHRLRLESQAERLQIGSQYRQSVDSPKDAYEIPLPPVQIIDLRQELRAGNRSIFSRALVDAIDETLERSEQAILFLNRRGTATFVICRDCGHVLQLSPL